MSKILYRPLCDGNDDMFSKTCNHYAMFLPHILGSFYASDSLNEEESVLALATDEENTILISGDTMGRMYVWDIKDYYRDTNEEVSI